MLENPAYLAVRVMEQIIAEGSGSLFGDEVPRIEDEHDDEDEHEHDFPNFGIWFQNRLLNRRAASV